MDVTPIISIFVPSNRPWYWERFCGSLNTNGTPFEVIFVGPKPPTYDLPENVHYINSAVKPAQCAEIGFRACKGEYCMFALDDIMFGAGTLDILLEVFKSLDREDAVVSCLPYLNDVPLNTNRYRFWDRHKNSPITPICGLYKTSVVEKLGCVDKNFIATFWDIDLSMRLYVSGGIGIFCPGTVANEIVPKDIDRLCSYGYKLDRPTLDYFWTLTKEEFKKRKELKALCTTPKKEKGVLCNQRLQPFEPFVIEKLYIESQGPKGKW